MLREIPDEEAPPLRSDAGRRGEGFPRGDVLVGADVVVVGAVDAAELHVTRLERIQHHRTRLVADGLEERRQELRHKKVGIIGAVSGSKTGAAAGR